MLVLRSAVPLSFQQHSGLQTFGVEKYLRWKIRSYHHNRRLLEFFCGETQNSYFDKHAPNEGVANSHNDTNFYILKTLYLNSSILKTLCNLYLHVRPCVRIHQDRGMVAAPGLSTSPAFHQQVRRTEMEKVVKRVSSREASGSSSSSSPWIINHSKMLAALEIKSHFDNL